MKKLLLQKRDRRLLLSIALILGLAALDQLSKALIVAYLPYPGAPTIDVIPYLFNVTHVRNTGAAFSFGANSRAAMIVFIVLTFVCLAAIVYALRKWGGRNRLFFTSLSMIGAGALGNLIDRLANGYVVDFIRFTFWPQFACFNFADICVCIGAVLFVVDFIFFEGRTKGTKHA